jgi:hypothetical protein
MLELRQRYLTDRRPAWLRRAGDLLILSLSFPVLFSSPLFVNGATMLANQVSFHTVLKGHRSGVSESVQIVARSQSEWSALWKRHAAIESNPPPLPAIDFSKEIVVAVFLGEKPTGGHDIEIMSMEQNNDVLLVSFVEKSPPPGGLATQALTQPFHIVRVAARSAARVNFRRLP